MHERSRTRRIPLLASCLACLLMLGTAGMAPAASAQERSVSPAACTLAPTNGTVTRFIGLRWYTLHVPAGLSGPEVPLLLSMHGAGGFSQSQESTTGWNAFAGSHDFIVAYPQGLLNLWNFARESYDVRFLRQVVGDVSSQWCVDPSRIYADGHSNGAFMSQRLACDAPNKFAAVVEYAGGSPTAFGSPCTPSRPIGVGLFHGEDDRTVSVETGKRTRDEWVARNGCSRPAVSEPVSDGILQRFTGCAGGVEVWWRTYPNQGHGWPTGARGEDQRSTMWKFLLAHPRP